jgi:hypothetical protein
VVGGALTNRWTGVRIAGLASRDFRGREVCAHPVNSSVRLLGLGQNSRYVKVEYITQNQRLEVALSDESDGRLFNGVAEAILRKFRGRLKTRVEAITDTYWDIEIAGQVITLHMDWTGISLFAENHEVSDLIREIGSYLEGIEPKPLFREMFYLRNLFRIRGAHKILI